MPKPRRAYIVPKVVGFCGFLPALWSAFRFITLTTILCLFFYVFPPYRCKQILDALFATASAVGSMAKTISTDERRAELFVGHLTKSGRDLWSKLENLPNEI
jgi:hypothetical protein